MSHLRTALLVIDAQQSFEHRPYWSPSDAPVFHDRLQYLVAGATARQIPIAQIFHVEESGAFSLESGFVKTMDSLSIAPDVTFYKQRHSALIGSGLSVWLTERGIQQLIVSGIRTEQCCETTTRHASDCGYSVDFVSEATLTFAMTDRQGRHWPAADIKARTELVLDGRFARVLTAAEALAAFDQQRSEAGRQAA
ncbi:MAG TPA: isochorismatase family protein [Steroidobacteraceae bacterium]|jgi:nicotinamidase-related amidase